MQKPFFYILDVFAEKKYAGNQLAVFRNTTALSDTEMQQIAREMNFSETTFILSDEQRKSGYDVRIFTPNAELPFAGHPTLGTAYAIQREIIKKPVDQVTLNLKVGQIPVAFSYKKDKPDMLWMKQNQPSFGRTLTADEVCSVLSLDRTEIDERFPIEEVSTGVYDLMVPLKKLDSIKKAAVVRDRYFELVENLESKGILIFAPETYSDENDLNVRFFAEALGVPEDPATGSANGCLAGYLVKNNYFNRNKIDIRVEQGYEIGRPSLLYLRAEKKADVIDIFVGGRVVMICRGEFV